MICSPALLITIHTSVRDSNAHAAVPGINGMIDATTL
jgi:hypothetical protein